MQVDKRRISTYGKSDSAAVHTAAYADGKQQHTDISSSPLAEVTPLHFVLLGDLGVGKTSIMLQYIDKKFEENTRNTLGIGVKSKSIRCGERDLLIHVRDTGGQERFASLTSSHYRGASAFVVVYDITDGLSFRSVKGWFEGIGCYMEKNRSEVPILLVANKMDLSRKREISGEVLSYTFFQDLMRTGVTLLFHEVSAKTGEGIEEAFAALIKATIKHDGSNSTTTSNPGKSSHMDGGGGGGGGRSSFSIEDPPTHPHPLSFCGGC